MRGNMDSGDEEILDATGTAATDEKDWQRMKEILRKDGYREGLQRGKDHYLQEHYNKAYELSLLHGFRVGELKGIVTVLLETCSETERQRLTELLNEILKVEETIVVSSMQPEDNFSTILETTNEKWNNWCVNMLKQFSKIYPDTARSLETKWYGGT